MPDSNTDKSARGNGRQPDGMFALTVVQCRDEWERRSGQRLSRARVHQIILSAERKLRQALRSTLCQ